MIVKYGDKLYEVFLSSSSINKVKKYEDINLNWFEIGTKLVIPTLEKLDKLENYQKLYIRF